MTSAAPVRAWLSWGVLVAFLALAVAGYTWLFGTLSGASLSVVSASGALERDRNGVRVPALVGDELRTADGLHAGTDARAILDAGGGARIVLEAGTDITVLDIARDEVRVSLEGGRIHATVRPEGPALAVEAGATRLRARDAELVLGRAAEAVAVEVQRGSAEVVDASGVSRSVDAGVVVRGHSGGVAFDEATEALLLALAAPPEMTRADTVTVRGTVSAGAHLTARIGAHVRGDAVADANGAFALPVGLAEGENLVDVEAVDLLGRTTVTRVRVVRDSTAPKVGVSLRMR